MSTPPTIRELWDFNQPASSEARFRSQLAQAPPASEWALELLTQVARAQGLQRQFAQAHQTLDTVAEQLTPAYRRAQVRYWLERGRLFNSSGSPEQAQPLFLQAWHEALAAGEEFLAVDAAHMLAIVEPPDRQLAWHRQAIDLAERSTDPPTKAWLGSLYNNLGWSYQALGQNEAALAVFERALAWRQAAGQMVESRIAAWSVARILRELNRVEEALARQRQLADAWAAAGGGDGYVWEELGECLLALGRAAEAAPNFARAYAALWQDPWLVANEVPRLERLRQLGEATVVKEPDDDGA
jgi:tetratricopeptide (TPR) repeat protein